MLPISDEDLIASIHKEIIAIRNASACDKQSTTATPDVPCTTATPDVPCTTATPDVPCTTATPDVPCTTATPDVPCTTATPDVPCTTSKADVASRPCLSGDSLHILQVIYRFTINLAFNR